MVEALTCQGWEKPMKHRLQLVNICPSSGGNAQIPPLGSGGEFYTVWYNTLDHVQSSER